MIKITKKQKDQLWWLIINVDYNYSRISIADHELTDDHLTLWLEDKQDFKNSLDECLQLDLSIKDFGRIIRTENMNSYEGQQLHPNKQFVYRTRVQINEAITWYVDDATLCEQQWAREAMLKALLTQLVETEVADFC
jgi:hypothetical protein